MNTFLDTFNEAQKHLGIKKSNLVNVQVSW